MLIIPNLAIICSCRSGHRNYRKETEKITRISAKVRKKEKKKRNGEKLTLITHTCFTRYIEFRNMFRNFVIPVNFSKFHEEFE